MQFFKTFIVLITCFYCQIEIKAGESKVSHFGPYFSNQECTEKLKSKCPLIEVAKEACEEDGLNLNQEIRCDPHCIMDWNARWYWGQSFYCY